MLRISSDRTLVLRTHDCNKATSISHFVCQGVPVRSHAGSVWLREAAGCSAHATRGVGRSSRGHWRTLSGQRGAAGWPMARRPRLQRPRRTPTPFSRHT
eukprot:2487968-Alexandrium_andersonii.AAC.1